MNEKTSFVYLACTKSLKYTTTEIKPEQTSLFLLKLLQIHTQCGHYDY